MTAHIIAKVLNIIMKCEPQKHRQTVYNDDVITVQRQLCKCAESLSYLPADIM